MKKNYLKPESQVVKIETITFLAGSPDDVTINNSGSVDANAVESRGYDDWDD